MAAWLGVMGVVYVASVTVLVNLPLPTERLETTNLPPIRDFAFERGLYAEADSQRNIDILFLGSSHARFFFDPAFFDSLGVRTFTIGSPVQTPEQSLVILDRYLPRMRPKVVVFETYPTVLANEGVEALANMAGSLPISEALWGAMVRAHSLAVWNGFLCRWVARNLGGDTSFRYPGRGFMTVRPGFNGDRNVSVTVTRPLPRQLAALRRATDLARAAGSRVVFLVQPIPVGLRRVTLAYDDGSRDVAMLADSMRVPFTDFNYTMQLDSSMYFDSNHLTYQGTRAVLPAVVAELRRMGILAEHGGLVPSLAGR
ncbi:MAG TPA: hypothetical protein VGI83_08500 [Gemmatimonadales bacterium]